MSNDESTFAPETGRLALGDVEMAYLELGEGPLAICLHGFPDTAWSWRHLMPALADAGYRAVAPFLRGYAPTTAPADQNGQVGAHVADIAALHDALGGGADSVLIGHDWGAVIAYGCAVHAPDRWRRVVAASVPPGPIMAQAFMDYDQLRRSWYMFFFLNPLSDLVVPLDDVGFIDRLWADWSPGYDGTADAARAREALAHPTALATALDTYRSSLGTSEHDPRYADEQTATGAVPPQPCLYLHGTDDRCIGVGYASPAAQVLAAGSAIAEIEGAGHFLQLEQPDRVNGLILDFLRA
jgi:pimeloyl-ACP methyl ester carboxylesterase